MHKWEYINFSQSVSFCEGEDPGPDQKTRYILFPCKGLPDEKHKEYTFEQWSACFMVNMAAITQRNPRSTVDLCTYFYTILY